MQMSKNCESCENSFGSINELNHHVVKVHIIIGSPESKKLRMNTKHSKEIEIQVCEKDFEIENEQKLEVEDMEIDSQEESEKLSKLRDEKILQRQKSLEEQEAIEKIEVFERLEEEKKRKRQMSTDKKKKKKAARKEKSIEIQKENMKENEKSDKIRIINDKFKPIFKQVGLDIQNYRIFKVKGDGACGSNCAALACHHDERLGQYVRRNINDFIVKYWPYFKDSMVFPHAQMVGNEEVIFGNEIEYLDFLKNNSKSGRLWMDHTDLQAMSNYYQIEIHVLTTNIGNIVEPNARWTHMEPDVRMKTFSPVPQGLPGMWLMHVDDVHFDLIVHKDSLLATEGSIGMEKKVKSQDSEKIFETNSSLKGHMSKVHEEESQVNCDLCEKLFRTEEDLKDHVLKEHAEEGKFHCKACTRIFKTQKGLEGHMKKIHGEKEMSADNEIGPGYMGWRIDEKDEDIQHDKLKAYDDLKKDVKILENRMSSFEKEYKQCIEALKKEVHERTKAEETAKVLREIVELHNKEDKREIEENVAYSNEEGMDIDEETGVWLQQQKRKSLKINKMKRKHAQTFICGTCGKNCSSQSSHFEHLKTHIQTKTYACQNCKKNFSDQNELVNHESSHTQTSTYSCATCKETFGEKSLLETHKEQHRQGYYDCQYCKKRFSNENQLEEHTNVHTKTDCFRCEKCGIFTKDHGDLENHKKTHAQSTQVVESQCGKCDKVYPNMSKLRRHDWRSHRTIDCNICGITLESRDQISNHRKTEHKMSRKIKCKYFPNCIDENECFFLHEENDDSHEEERKSRFCLKGENCEDQSCEYSEVNHLSVKNVMCRYQSKCKKTECMFKHAIEKASFLAACTQNWQER